MGNRPAEQLMKKVAKYPEGFGKKTAGIIWINMFQIMKFV